MPKSPKLAKKHPNFRQGLQNLDLHECGFVCADIHVNITVYQPALSVDPKDFYQFEDKERLKVKTFYNCGYSAKISAL